MIVPSYYSSFRCIAGECRHNCCIGWEIDIDKNTYELYKNVGGNFGMCLAENIDEDASCFKLGEGERCPFLNGKNLCDIIINLGEEALCQICSDHPRFYNFVGENEEAGLGMCCEAAAKLILSQTEKVTFCGERVAPDSAEEKAFLGLRDDVLNILQDRTYPLGIRFEILEEKYGAGIGRYKPAEVKALLKGLERLESVWNEWIDGIDNQRNINIINNKNWQTAFEQLSVYFVFRHLAGAITDGKYIERIRFAGFGVYVIALMFDGESRDKLAEIARMFSAEIEYSEENTGQVLEYLNQQGGIL